MDVRRSDVDEVEREPDESDEQTGTHEGCGLAAAPLSCPSHLLPTLAG
jgi:hypothetical protein